MKKLAFKVNVNCLPNREMFKAGEILDQESYQKLGDQQVANMIINGLLIEVDAPEEFPKEQVLQDQEIVEEAAPKKKKGK